MVMEIDMDMEMDMEIKWKWIWKWNGYENGYGNRYGYGNVIDMEMENIYMLIRLTFLNCLRFA